MKNEGERKESDDNAEKATIIALRRSIERAEAFWKATENLGAWLLPVLVAGACRNNTISCGFPTARLEVTSPVDDLLLSLSGSDGKDT